MYLVTNLICVVHIFNMFYIYGDHRDLHSFPTRRSSDLLPRVSALPVMALIRARRGDPEDRSEEHTSELQSRLHLVCRLLLEKKKSKINPAAIQRYCTLRP